MKIIVTVFSILLLLVDAFSFFGVIYSVNSSESLENGWPKTFDGMSYADGGRSVVQTFDGGYALLCQINSLESDHDFWLIKLDANGNHVWNKTYGGPDADMPESIIQTHDGGYALIGTRRYLENNSNDFWLVKTDNNGNLEWAQTYGGSESDYACSVVQTSDGGFALAGSTYSFGSGFDDFWLIKIDSNGNLQWSQTYGTPISEEANCLIMTSDGGFALAGSVTIYDWSTDCWLVKIDSNGNFEWSQKYGGTKDDSINSVVQTNDGGFALVSTTYSFGSGSADFWLLKTDVTGNLQWNQTYGGASSDWPNTIFKTDDGGYVVIGDTASFGGSLDCWLVKTDANGEIEWDEIYGGLEDNEVASSGILTSDGSFVLLGTLLSTSAGGPDVLLIKSNENVTFPNNENGSVLELPSPTIIVPDDYPLIQDAINAAEDGDVILVKSGVYYETLVINKSLTLIGENREQTIIDAHKIRSDVVSILASNVVFTNFTLGNTGYIFSSGGTQPSGIYIQSTASVIRNIIYGVNGPAFKTNFFSRIDLALRDNIVANSGFMIRGMIDSYELFDSEAVLVTDMLSPFPADIELLDGNQILHLTRTNGASLGDLVLTDNATLIVDNFEAKAQSLEANGNSRIILINNALLYVHQLSGATPMRIYLSDDASFNSTDSETVIIVCTDKNQVWAKNSTIYIEASGAASVHLENCTCRVTATTNSNVTLTNSNRCTLNSMADDAHVYASNCNVGSSGSIGIHDRSKLWVIASTFDASSFFGDESTALFSNCTLNGKGDSMRLSGTSNVQVINSTWNKFSRLEMSNQSNLLLINNEMTENEATDIVFNGLDAKIHYCWYLSATIKSTDGALLENADVEVYLENGTLIDNGLTDENGKVQFVLARHIWNLNDKVNEYFVNAHTVKVARDSSRQEITVASDSNQEVILSVNVPVSEFSSLLDLNLILIISVVVAVALILVYFVSKRK